MDYLDNFKRNIVPFTLSRLLPYLSIAVIIVLQAHKAFSDLSMLAYLLATYAVPVSIISMSIAIIGNFVALNKGDFEKNSRLFRASLSASMVLAIATTAVCLLIHVYWIGDSTISSIDKVKLGNLSFIYLLSTPLLVINTFLFFFNEAYKKASSSTRIESISAAFSFIFVFAAYAFSEDDKFCYFAVASIVVCEALTLFMYVLLSINRGFKFKLAFDPSIFKEIAVVGLPVALGLGVQKIFFLLLTERLIRIDNDLVSMLSVSMSIVGFLLIPASAFSQLHSLHVGRNYRGLARYNGIGILYLICISIFSFAPFVLFSNFFYEVFGGNEKLADNNLTLAITCFLFSSALTAFSMSQLRAVKDTLIPQVLIGSLMLLVLYPIFASSYFDDSGLPDFLYAESVALFVCCIILHFRTIYLGRSILATPEDKALLAYR